MRTDAAFEQIFEINGGDFMNAGEPSIKIRNILKDIGIDADIIRRVSIAAYEAEMNVVMYAQHGMIKLLITPEKIFLRVEDKGQGIEDIELAMRPGFSTATEEMRERGFGAGMGLPNIKRNSDHFSIRSTVGQGTKLEMIFELNGKNG
jgi:anti-sigma regulatory factor (Ser/Thr protein kinase)